MSISGGGVFNFRMPLDIAINIVHAYAVVSFELVQLGITYRHKPTCGCR